MGGTLLLVLWGCLFGAMFLMLFFGYRSIEEERAKAEKAQPAERVLDRPRFFANLTPADLARPEATATAGASSYDAYVDAVARALEDHIRLESAVTSAFANEPSLARLYGRSAPPIAQLLRRYARSDATPDSPEERAG